MITINYKDKRPIYEQLVERIEDLAAGYFEPGAQLPSVRQLALELSINPNTIQRAYGELERRGVIVSAKGKGNFVSPDAEDLRESKRRILWKDFDEVTEKLLRLNVSEEEFNARVARLKKEGFVHD